MDLRVLGSVEVSNGHRLAIGGPNQRRILAALAVQAGEVVSVDRLAELTWGDEPPDQADRNIQSYVSRLRSGLGDDLAGRLVTRAPGYALMLEDGELDVDRFERGVSAARRHLDRGEPAEALDVIDDAQELWRGRPYGEFADEGFALTEVARLDALKAEADELRCEILLELGQAADALGALQSIIDTHPLSESPRRLQILGLYRAGRQVEALRAFHDFRELLLEEVGVEPSSELAALDRAVATNDRSLLQTGGLKPVQGYELHELIGAGAFAEVYRGTQPSLDRAVAVKAIRAELANKSSFIRAFETEARLVAGLEHPHIVPLYDFWREPDRAFLVMRWLTGGSIEAARTPGGWDLERTATLVEQVGSALATAHRAGVVHRDVKPANILLDTDGNAYLSDFGIALDVDAEHVVDETSSFGSLAYASPEQLRREPVGPPTDVYGLAMTVFEMLSGELPYGESTDLAMLLDQKLNEALPSVHQRRPEVPVAVDEVLAVATATDPALRYGTAQEFVLAFVEAIVAGPAPTAELRTVAQRVTDATGQLDNPYKGLRAFDEADAADFFGRDGLVQELLRCLAGPSTGNALALVGASGSGKSSVVRAGLLPAIRGGAVPGSDQWFITSMSPGTHPFEALETALLRVAVNPPSSLVEQMSSEPRGVLRALRRILPSDDDAVVLVIDQFEELFTLCADDAVRAAFLEGITEAVTDPTSPLRLILTLRADFYDQPLRYDGFAEILKHQGVTITPLSAEELEQAIVGPATQVGVEFEAGLVADILADVAAQPGGLPLLQYALTELFERRIGSQLSIDAYRGIGGLTGALARRAEELYEECDWEEQAAFRRVFGRLVTLGEGTEDTRRRVQVSELGDDVAAQRVIERFGAARLLTFDRDAASREPTVEVAHEALIREWPRLRRWLDDGRDDLRVHRHLTTAAVSWEERDRDPGELYRGGRLEAAEAWAADHGGDLNAAETAFLGAGLELRSSEEAEERRRIKRLRRLLAGVGALAAVAVLAGLLAIRSQSDARDGQRQAEAARAEAETRRIGADAAQLVASNRRVALLLAAEAHRRDPGPETLGALQRVLTGTGPFLGYLGAGRTYTSVAWLDDERIIGLHEGGVDVYAAATGARLLEAAQPARFSVAASPNGDFFAMAATVNDTVLLIDSETGETRAALEHPDRVRALEFSPDGTTLASGDEEGTLRLWSVASGQLVGPPVDAHPESTLEEVAASLGVSPGVHDPDELPTGIRGLSWTPDGSQLATAGGFFVRVWSASTLQRNSELVIERRSIVTSDQVVGRPNEVAFIDDATLLVAVENFIQRFDVVSGEKLSDTLASLAVTNAGFESFSVDVAGGQAVVGLPDGALRMIDLDTATTQLDVSIEGGIVSQGFDLAVSPDDRRVAVATDGIALFSLAGSGLIAEAIPRQGLQELMVSGDATVATTNDVRVEGGNDRARLWIRREGRLVELEHLPDDYYRYIPDLFGGVVGFRRDGRIDYLDPETGEPTGVSITASTQWAGAHSPERQLVAVGLGQPDLTFVQVFDAATGEHLVTLDELAVESATVVSNLRFNGDGTRLVGATDNGHAVIWDTGTWETVGTPLGEGGGIAVLATYTPDDEHILVVDLDGVITVRDAQTHQPTGRRILGTNGAVAMWGPWGFAEDGRHVATQLEGRPRLIDLETDAVVGNPFPGDIGGTAMVPPGGRYATSVVDGVGLIWNLDIRRWPEIACQAAGRNLTEAEWAQFGPTDAEYTITCPRWPGLGEAR